MLQCFRSIKQGLAIAVLCLIAVSVQTQAYQKPGAPVTLATTSVISSELTSLEAVLVFQQTGSASVSVSATPNRVAVTNNPTFSEINHIGQQISVPITLNYSLKEVDYVNLFVTFLAENGATSHRALSIKVLDDKADASSISKSESVSSDTPIYMQAKETIRQ